MEENNISNTILSELINLNKKFDLVESSMSCIKDEFNNNFDLINSRFNSIEAFILSKHSDK